MSGTASRHVAHPTKRAYKETEAHQRQTELRDGVRTTSCVPLALAMPKAVLPASTPANEPMHALFIYSCSI